jgi:DNA-binding CsgD family transcriptional regulator
MDNAVLARIIAAIGEPDFPAVATEALRTLLDFDLTAALAHPAGSRPVILFDNFDVAGARQGLANYARLTHTVNPMLAQARTTRVCRASDFVVTRDGLVGMDARARAHVVASDEEELGFRTVGWPAQLEEIAFYLDAGENLVELGFYRERRRRPAQADPFTTLQRISQPVASAFARHFTLGRPAPPPAAVLSAREREICDLMLRGCTSEAIAAYLGISPHTVKDHRKQIFRKLAVGSLAELFALHAARN